MEPPVQPSVQCHNRGIIYIYSPMYSTPCNGLSRTSRDPYGRQPEEKSIDQGREGNPGSLAWQGRKINPGSDQTHIHLNPLRISLPQVLSSFNQNLIGLSQKHTLSLCTGFQKLAIESRLESYSRAFAAGCPQLSLELLGIRPDIMLHYVGSIRKAYPQFPPLIRI